MPPGMHPQPPWAKRMDLLHEKLQQVFPMQTWVSLKAIKGCSGTFVIPQ